MTKTILITGASTGIGRTTALELAKEGYQVFAGIRNDADAQSLRAENLVNLQPIRLDVSQPDQIAQSVETLKKSCGNAGLAALINNAGINYITPFELADEARVRQLMEVNFFGMMNLTRALLPLLQAYTQTGDTAKVINIGSIGSKIGLPWEFSYHASKFAVLGMSQALRFELDALGIRVCCVMPGGIRTPFFAKSGEETQQSKKTLTGPNADYYARNMSKMWDAAMQFERFATPPIKVAQSVRRLIERRNPPLRTVIGLDAKLINFLVWAGWENVLKSQFVQG